MIDYNIYIYVYVYTYIYTYIVALVRRIEILRLSIMIKSLKS